MLNRMDKFSKVLYVIIGSIVLSSCGNTNAPVKTINDQKAVLHKTIEETTKRNHVLDDYQSLSFGQMKVFKPDAFIILDSVYTVKQEYLKNNDLRGLRRSGIEDSIHIHSSFFLFDYKDSLLLVTPFYDFKLESKQKDLFYAYQFDYHFVTNREIYISEAEWDFLRFFRTRQFELIGGSELEPFMQHTMIVMEAAKKSSTVDFRNLSKILAMNYFSELAKKIAIESFSELMVIEEKGEVINYEFKVDWIDETMEGMNKSTSFTFSPYLEIEGINTVIL